MQSKRAENLSYVHSNLHLLSHKQHGYKQRESKMWDIEPKHTDLDASTSQLVTFEASESEDTTSTSASDIGIGSSNYNDDDDDLENPFDD